MIKLNVSQSDNLSEIFGEEFYNAEYLLIPSIHEVEATIIVDGNYAERITLTLDDNSTHDYYVTSLEKDFRLAIVELQYKLLKLSEQFEVVE